MLSTMALLGRFLGKSNCKPFLSKSPRSRQLGNRLWGGIEVSECRILLSARSAKAQERLTAKEIRRALHSPKNCFDGANFRELLQSLRERLSEAQGRPKPSDPPIVMLSDEYNVPPEAYAMNLVTIHDSPLHEEVYAYDENGDTLTYSVVSQPSQGSVSLNSQTGFFTYTPPPLWVGGTSFVFGASDGNGGYDEATVAIDVVNSAPYAGPDDFQLSFPAEPAPIALYVLENDYDLDNDDLTIQSVTSSQAGATIWIDESGLFLWYLPPELGTEDSWTAGDPTGPPEELDFEVGGPGGYEAFTDSFVYFLTDPLGEPAEATVTVQAIGEPTWSWGLYSDFNTATEVGVEGQPGYRLEIRQTFGADAVGLKLLADEQGWQINHTQLTWYGLAPGGLSVVPNLHGYIWDVNNLENDVTGVRMTDELGLNIGPSTLFSTQQVEKTLGRNPYDSNGNLIKGDPGDHVLLAADAATVESTLRGPTLTVFTFYTYVNKTAIEAAKTAGTISQQEYDGLVAQINGLGLNYATLPGKWEHYQIGDHGFQFPAN